MASLVASPARLLCGEHAYTTIVHPSCVDYAESRPMTRASPLAAPIEGAKGLGCV